METTVIEYFFSRELNKGEEDRKGKIQRLQLHDFF